MYLSYCSRLVRHLDNIVVKSIFIVGNDILHRLTANSNQELKIVMSDFSNVTKYADYTTFHVADEAAGYRLTIGGYSGTAGKSECTTKTQTHTNTFDSHYLEHR